MKKIGLVGLKTIKLSKDNFEEIQIKALSTMPQMDCVVMHVDVIKRIMVSKYADVPIVLYVDDNYKDYESLKQFPVVGVMKSSDSGLHREYIIDLALKTKVTEKKLKQAQLLLARVSQTDLLTNIYNRPVILERLQEEIEKYRRYGEEIGLCMIEIDGFGSINDKVGRFNGDILLQNIAQSVQGELRKSDLIGRFDDNTFIVLLPHTKSYGTLVFAERIRAMVELKDFHLNHQTVKVTISLGVSTMRSKEETVDDILNRSIEALREAKDKGQNQVIIH
jgi:diguanylate cyclase (GGDEF)-like protein